MVPKRSRRVRTQVGLVLASLLLGLAPAVAVTGCSSSTGPTVKSTPNRMKLMRENGQASRKAAGSRRAGGAPLMR
jgi:hypothetical protein